jgi:cytochrome c biogenesis protein CcmG, thiol:disulfide interchange protein DsbE
MRPWLKVALLVAFAGVAALWLVPSTGPDAAHVGRPAPALSLRDLDGREVTLAGLRGRAVALNFWATWCQPCKEELPGLAEAWREARNSCVTYVGVTEESSREEAAAEVTRHGILYPVVLDADGEVARAYGVTALPRTVLIDAEGTVRRVFTGRISRAQIEEALAPLVPAACPRNG